MFGTSPIRRVTPRITKSFCSSRQLSTKVSIDPHTLRWRYVIGAIAGTTVYFGTQNLYFYQVADAEEAPSWIAKIRGNTPAGFDRSGPPPNRSASDSQPPPLDFPEATKRLKSSKKSTTTQNDQTKISWENPGVYSWGLNNEKAVAPDSDDRWVKTPRRLSFFDGILLRDLKLGSDFGAAINDTGDLLVWGSGYSDSKVPELSLKGKNLKSISLSDSRIIALSNNGTVYSIPASKKAQESDPKLKEASWLWTTSSTNVACRDITPTLGFGEKVVSISGGLEHVLMLTSGGRVFSAASSTNDFPKFGQLGIPGLSWYSRPTGPFDQAHELKTLRGIKIQKIATGDAHSVLFDKHGKVYTFGDNSYGQLGFWYNPENMNLNDALNINTHYIDTPKELSIAPIYAGTTQSVEVKSVAAGGQNTYLIVEAKDKSTSQISAEALVCGRGIWGSLGNGKWTHIQWTPTRIPAFSSISEYNEDSKKSQPIKVSSFEVGATHVAAIMANITRVTAKNKDRTDTNWGSDVYFFGNNENFQIGNGKRANLCVPSHIQPLTAINKSTEFDYERFQLTPPKKITFAGRSVWVEQRIECGRQATAVYSAVL